MNGGNIMSRIITISREFGSGGRFIGKEVADRLGIPFFDKEIIARVAAETGLAPSFIEKRGEYAAEHSVFSYAFAARTPNGLSVEDEMMIVQNKILHQIADEGPCVIVGRCADYVLRDRADLLNVFICGDDETKAERVMKLYGKDKKGALSLMKDTDKKRAINYQYCTDQKWGSHKNYDITLNSSRLGYDACIDLIVSLAK